MTNLPISGLTAASTLAGTEEVAIVQSGATVRTTVTDIASTAGPLTRMTGYCFSGGTGGDLVGAHVTWPTTNSYSVLVPSWATRAICRATIGQVFAITDVCNHGITIGLGALESQTRRIRWQPVTAGTAGCVDSVSAQDINLSEEFDVTTIQNTTVQVRTIGNLVSGTGGLRSNSESVSSIDVYFFEI